jgi:hypothetical protein
VCKCDKSKRETKKDVKESVMEPKLKGKELGM